jgi:hypothetical protein
MSGVNGDEEPPVQSRFWSCGAPQSRRNVLTNADVRRGEHVGHGPSARLYILERPGRCARVVPEHHHRTDGDQGAADDAHRQPVRRGDEHGAEDGNERRKLHGEPRLLAVPGETSAVIVRRRRLGALASVWRVAGLRR